MTETVSSFHFDPRRSGDVVKRLVRDDFCGVVGSDRYNRYKNIAVT